MAQLKDLIVNGASRFIGDIFGTNATLNGNVMPETDNTQFLGDSTHRWKFVGTLTGNASTATAANITTTINALSYYTDATGTFGNSAITITKASKHIAGFINGGQKSGTTLGTNATAEGGVTTASGSYSHAEGGTTTASGIQSHAEGGNTTASGADSHAEGYNTTASGSFSHAEGGNATASGNHSHAEGYNTTASGIQSHAEGADTTASGNHSHAEGYYTTAQRKSQHVFGEYNVLDAGGTDYTTRGNYIEIVGNGSNANTRSNARTLDWNGNETIAGNLTAKSLYVFGLNSTNSTRYITSTAVNNIAFSISNKYPLVVTDTTIQCGNAVAGTINLGASTHRWKSIYAATSIDLTDSSSNYTYLSPGNMELSYSAPYIDFHRANNSTVDYTARIINYLDNNSAEVLSMQSSQIVALETNGKVAALYSDGNFAVWNGDILAGAGNANREHEIIAHSSAGQIYLYSQGSSSGAKGIYARHSNSSESHVLQVTQDGTVYVGSGSAMWVDSICTHIVARSHGNNAGAGLEIREAEGVTNTQDNHQYAPRMSFRWEGRQWSSLCLESDGVLRLRWPDWNDQTAAGVLGYFQAGTIWGAVWNDYAEMRNVPMVQKLLKPKKPVENYKIEKRDQPYAGSCVIEAGDDTMVLSTERLQRGGKIISDTYGFNIGETENAKTPIAVSGRVLAFIYEGREEAANHIGWPVCTGPNGTVSIMTEQEEKDYPSRIIGTISAIPDYETWGEEHVPVNGRIWIYVR